MAGPPVPFSALPLDKTNEAAHLNAWEAYGPDDELGFLNRQTDEIVAAAARSEIKTGTRVNLNAAMDFLGEKPLFNRQAFQKNVYQKKPRIVHDDTWHFNTQSSSQWDGFRHYGYQKAERFYNNTTLEDIAGTSAGAKSNPNRLGIQNFARRGIFGRGVLVDFDRWAAGPGRDTVQAALGGRAFNPLQRDPVKLEWLLAALKHQGTEIRFGDILVTRLGFTKALASATPEQIKPLYEAFPPAVSGIDITDDTLKWIWDHFSAVAGDQVGFEAMPFVQPYSGHEVFLAGWGCPIGELFDLEELSKECEKQGRWSFFFTSEVVNVPGGVASPPNAVAIF